MLTAPNEDWEAAVQIANLFFEEAGILGNLPAGPRIGRPGSAETVALWNGKTVNASTPGNLLHEVAHYQIAPSWRRHTPGYGLGVEPEGNADVPLLVSYKRAEKEENLASALGIYWEAYLHYSWAFTANSHGWGNPSERFGRIEEFAEHTKAVTEMLQRLKLLDAKLVPQPGFAPSWRCDAFKWFDEG